MPAVGLSALSCSTSPAASTVGVQGLEFGVVLVLTLRIEVF